jgi:exodeoxyribonuclease V alpha subunit
VSGVGFNRADTIALSMGVERDSERRAQAAAVFAVAEAEQKGDTFIPLDELGWRTAKLLGLQPDPDALVAAPGLAIEESRVYRARTLETELAVAETLHSRAQSSSELEHEPADTPPQGEEHSMGLTEEQWAAVKGAFASRVSVVTGGPGVGKTICTKAIVGEAIKARLRVALCAPTGRAARRLQDATGHEAETIHRMLEWIPGNKPKIGPGHPLPADLVVIDEASMLNLSTMHILLSGLAEATHLVFVGDVDQLPPIGAGKPFDDLIASEVVPVVRLSQIFRQAAKSMITTAAHEINQGLLPHLNPQDDQQQDFFLIEREDPAQALATVVEMVAERIPERFDVDPIRDVQVLAPKRKGPVGINALNRELRTRLNPNGKPAASERFRVGDRLIQTRNAHELGLMNGSIVIVRSDDPDAGEMTVETDDGDSLASPYGETLDLEFAYAITVHKSQGCEVPIVVALCHGSQAGMLTRPLLYTAITRARRGCILVGEKSALEAGARRDDGGRRNSTLVQRLRG